MVRKYKKKRLVIENTIDKKPKGYELEASEREQTKKQIKKELEEDYEIKLDSESETDEE